MHELMMCVRGDAISSAMSLTVLQGMLSGPHEQSDLRDIISLNTSSCPVGFVFVQGFV